MAALNIARSAPYAAAILAFFIASSAPTVLFETVSHQAGLSWIVQRFAILLVIS